MPVLQLSSYVVQHHICKSVIGERGQAADDACNCMYIFVIGYMLVSLHACSYDGIYVCVQCLKVLSGALVRSIPCAHNGFVYSLAWSKDDGALVSAGADCSAKVGSDDAQR